VRGVGIGFQGRAPDLMGLRWQGRGRKVNFTALKPDKATSGAPGRRARGMWPRGRGRPARGKATGWTGIPGRIHPGVAGA
jgi:hypothetical protein